MVSIVQVVVHSSLTAKIFQAKKGRVSISFSIYLFHLVQERFIVCTVEILPIFDSYLRSLPRVRIKLLALGILSQCCLLQICNRDKT